MKSISLYSKEVHADFRDTLRKYKAHKMIETGEPVTSDKVFQEILTPYLKSLIKN